MEYLLLNAPEKTSPISSPEKEIASPQKWEVGQIIDHKYEIQDILAKDREKIIHKVRHCQWNIPLAVRSQLDEESQVRFFHQAQRWVELDKHPNVVSAYYVQKIGGVPRLFVEYVKSKTLRQYMDSLEYDIETVIDIAIQICRGLWHAHRKGLLHADLRPNNIFITEENEVKIADFRSRENTIAFSPYMPPECFEPNWPIQQTVDIYAFGVLAYELCAKKLPFKADFKLKDEKAANEFKNIILTQPPQPLGKINIKVS